MERQYKILSTNVRYYPGPDEMDRSIPTMAVLVAGEIEDYAVYIGHSTDEQFVAAHGDKISFGEACAQFCGLEREHYRD